MAAKGTPNRNTAKFNMERQYIVFFDSEIDLSWNESDVNKFRMLWKQGTSVQEIAVALSRNPLEVVLLVIDLAEHEKIERRPTGIYGMGV